MSSSKNFVGKGKKDYLNFSIASPDIIAGDIVMYKTGTLYKVLKVGSNGQYRIEQVGSLEGASTSFYTDKENFTLFWLQLDTKVKFKDKEYTVASFTYNEKGSSALFNIHDYTITLNPAIFPTLNEYISLVNDVKFIEIINP